ncbi:MAG: hypothetical protein H7A36_03950 [Chlamydiales bacterium]|nr:hypothetical protein [Chlamydiales bacterium]
MRRGIDKGGSSRAYLVVQLSFSFFVMILLNPVRTLDFAVSTPSILFGLLGGLILGFFMWSLGKTLENGPPGLSLAIVNASSIMPALVLLTLFGSAYGHGYTLWNGLGSVLVAIGILWAGWTTGKNANKNKWLIFSIVVFASHVIYLVYLQWWAMALDASLPLSKLLPFHLEPLHLAWFMPAIFFSAALYQWVVYIKQESRLPNKGEMTYGLLGGVANGACAFFLIMAPQVATAWQNAMLFPLFSVTIIIACNTWAQFLYKERVNWLANGLCTAGLLIGTIVWNGL